MSFVSKFFYFVVRVNINYAEHFINGEFEKLNSSNDVKTNKMSLNLALGS